MNFFDLLSRYIKWEYVKILLLLLVGIWLIGQVRRRSKLKTWVEKHLSPKLAPRKRLLEAKRAEKVGDWVEAGFIYDQLGELDKALDCFEKAEDYPMCGELCVRMGRKDYAAEWFLLAEEPKRAAELFRDAGLYDRSAEIFLEAGLSLDAASAFSQGGQHRRAGEIYEASGNYVKAGDAFEKAEDYARAAENYARQIAESGGAEGRYVGSRERTELTRLSGRAAHCYQQIGELEKAGEILQTGEQYGLAAQVAEKLGQHRRAAELYQKSGDVRKAAEMYDRAGDNKTAASLVGDQQLHAGDQEAAAESFLASGDAIRAAEIFEGLGRYDRAAECYAGEEAFAQAADAALRADKKLDAAQYFERAKLIDRAAEFYAELGNYERASQLFAESGRYFDAAKAAAQTNAETLMVEYLQRVPPDDPDYLQAVLQLGRSFVQRGWSSLAIEKLNSALRDQEIRSDNLELWDVLARAYEAEGKLTRARELLHNMMSVQYDFQDIRERHSRILEKMEEQKRRETTLKASTGKRGDRYELEILLGQGGMGAVYKAYDRLLKRRVAYKVLSGEFASKPKARDQLLNEARAAAALNHPNIITIFDVGLEGDKAFICMELIEGESYADILRKKKRLEIPEAIHFLVSACQGLDHAHQRGIVHRDLKPSNLLLTKENRLKIVDFGLAQPIEDIKNAPPGTSLSGTPRYISPEQARGDPTDARSDVYSLGATLYNVLVGHPPFTEGNIIMHHLYTPPPPLRSERPEISPTLEELVLLCLSKHPAERYQSAGEVLSFASAARLL